MAAPNIVNVSTITGKTDGTALTSTASTSVLSNAAGSGKIFKLNALHIADVDGTAAAAVTVKYHYEAAGANTGFSLGTQLVVPAKSTIVVVEKNSAVYLPENRSIACTANTANDLEVVASYEEIS